MTDLDNPGDLQVSVRSEGPDLWVEAAGEVDISTSPRWEKAISEGVATRPKRIYVDMHLVSFIDSSGLAVLVRSHALAETQNCQLIVRAPSRQVDRVLELAGLNHHLNIEA
jgi:anti-sigma B factor antagonist